MCAIGIGVGGDHDLAVAQLLLLERRDERRANHVLAATEGDEDRIDFGVVEGLAVLGTEHVEDLAADGQDRLGRVVACLLGATTGRVALDDKDLAFRVRDRRIIDRVRQLARQIRVAHDRGRGVAQLLRDLGFGEAHIAGEHDAVEDLFGVVGVLLVGQPVGQRLGRESRDGGLRLLVVKAPLGLPLELRVLEHHRDGAGQAIGDVLGVKRLALVLLQSPSVEGSLVEDARQRAAQARDVRTAIDRVDDVAETEDSIVGGHRPLQRDLNRDPTGCARQGDDARMRDVAALVELADIVRKALFAAVLVFGTVGRAQLEGEVADEERLLAQALLDRRRREVRVLVEDRAVGGKAHGRARALALLKRTHVLDGTIGDTSLIALRPEALVASNLDL